MGRTIMGKTHPCHPEHGHELEPKKYKSPDTSSGCRMQGLGKTAASVLGPDARPAAGSCCKFKLKEYKTVFTCCVCMMDSYETKRYRCDHCDLARHEHCIQLGKNIEINSSPDSQWKGKVFELHDKPQIRGKYSSQPKWAKHCMVCGMLIKHYSYHYMNKKSKDINMHPYCANLARSGGGSSSAHELKLSEKKHICLWCRQDRPSGACTEKDSCWSYCLKKSNRPDMYIHVYCYLEMVIRALKGIVPSELGNNVSLRIVLKRKRSDGGAGSGWEVIAKEAIGLALDQLLGGGVGLIQIMLS